MNTKSCLRCRLLRLLLLLALGISVKPAAQAGVLEVHVGVTPKCPYGMVACYPSASAALRQLEGIETVSPNPDSYNCMAQVWLTDGGLPNVKQWQEHFKSMVGESYVFRGVEVTIEGTLEQKDGKLLLQSEGLRQPVALAALQHKLQWNFLKRRSRGPEEDERTAYQQLEAKNKESTGTALKVRVTGPLQTSDAGPVLEIREFFLLTPSAY
jgi:galactose oxidase